MLAAEKPPDACFVAVSLAPQLDAGCKFTLPGGATIELANASQPQLTDLLGACCRGHYGRRGRRAMISVSPTSRIFVFAEPTDMRKGGTGLSGRVSEYFAVDLDWGTRSCSSSDIATA